MASSWERLATYTLPSANANLSTASDSSLSGGEFAAKTHLKVLISFLGTSGNVSGLRYRFNGDSSGTGGSSGTYAHRNSNNGAADDTGNWKTEINPANQSGGAGTDILLTIDIINIPTKEKLCTNHMVFQHGTGAGTAPKRTENSAKWVNTSDSIHTIAVYDDGATNLDAGSTITVWGADDGVPFYPNLPNGTIFEQTNDYKYYMWDGTDTWNVVATT